MAAKEGVSLNNVSSTLGRKAANPVMISPSVTPASVRNANVGFRSNTATHFGKSRNLEKK